MRNKRKMSQNYQRLRHPHVVRPTNVNTNVAAVNMGLILARPCRPEKLSFTYASTAPTAFTVLCYGGNGEEIYRTNTLLASVTPKTFSCYLPRNTDFALYTNNGIVFTVNTATTQNGLTLAFNMDFLYKATNPSIF